MAPHRHVDDEKSFSWWGNPLSNTKNVCKKNDVKQQNGSQEKEEQKKRYQYANMGKKITQNSSNGGE